MEVHRVDEHQWRELRDLRLRALLEAPDAFRTRHEDAVERADEWWGNWASGSARGAEQAIFLAWEGDAPVGMVGVFKQGDRRLLFAMWTDRSRRCEGVGTALVEAAIEFARRIGCVELFLEVRFDNEEARRLYERCGFVDTGAGTDEREMSRPL